MEIIKIGLITFLFFYLTWLQLLYVSILAGVYYYYSKNKQKLLLEQNNYGNFIIYYLIFFLENSFMYSNYFYHKFKISFIGRPSHNYLVNLNDNFLLLRNYIFNKVFTFTLQSAIKIMMKLDRDEKKEIKIVKKKSKNTDIKKFLDELENK